MNNRNKYNRYLYTSNSSNFEEPDFFTKEKNVKNYSRDYPPDYDTFMNDNKMKNYSKKGNVVSKTVVTKTKIGPDGIPVTERHVTSETSILDKFGNRIPVSKNSYVDSNSEMGNFDDDLHREFENEFDRYEIKRKIGNNEEFTNYQPVFEKETIRTSSNRNKLKNHGESKQKLNPDNNRKHFNKNRKNIMKIEEESYDEEEKQEEENLVKEWNKIADSFKLSYNEWII